MGAFLTHGHEFAPFQAGNGGWQLSAPVVGNVDGDEALEIIVSYRNSDGEWLLDGYDYNGQRLNGFPHRGGSRPINASPTLADVDGDGRKEIVFTEGNQIVALNGENGSVLWRWEVNPLNYLPDAGFQTLMGGFQMTGLPLLQGTLPLTAEFFSEVSPPMVVDLEGDGSLEVVTAWKIDPDRLGSNQDYNPLMKDLFGVTEWGATGEVWSGGVVVSEARTGEKKFIYHFHQLVEAGLGLAQLDGDGAVEVLVLNDADSVVAFDITKEPGRFGEGMLHEKFGKNLRLLSGTYQRGVDVESADLDGDGLSEVLVSSSPISPNWQPHETILDDDGSVLWREWHEVASVPHAHGWFNSATMIPVNPDKDNRIDVLGFRHTSEITFRTWNGVELVSRPGWPKDFAPNLATPPVVGDVDGDGTEEIVMGTYHPTQSPSSGKLFVFGLGGETKFEVEIPGGVKHIPAIADVDNDGSLEVVVRSLAGKLHIQSFGHGGGGTVSWAGHRGGAARDGNFRENLYRPGTPIVWRKEGGYGRTSFEWRLPAGFEADGFKVFRAARAEGPFVEIGSLDGARRSFTDATPRLGVQHIYEVAAVYGSEVVRSAPFAVRAQLNGNLVANGGFELDDDANWDKWFTGEIPWTNMKGSGEAHRGERSMEIRLENHGSGSSITQYSHYGTPKDYIPVTPGVLYSFGGWMRSGGISAASRHWFEWDSSRTGENTNARPSLPWPSYFTPGLEAGTEETGWVYLNRVFEMPAGFSNVELRHRYEVEGRATGSVFIDEVFFRALPGPEDERWQEWISFGVKWRYLAGEAPANWHEMDFDASSWAEAGARFGHGSGPDQIVTALPKNQPAYYFRREFVVPEGKFEEFLLAAKCTDDYGGTVHPLRVWLNGDELVTGGIEAVSGTGNVVKYFDLAPFIELLRPGKNVIAVMLNNTWREEWDDVSFDLSLRAIAGSGAEAEPEVRINQLRVEPNGAMTLELSASEGSVWRLESADETSPLQWRMVETVIFNGAGVIYVTDSGQNARPFPGAVNARLYRLVKVPGSG